MKVEIISHENLINPEDLKKIRRAKKILKSAGCKFAIFYDNKGFYFYKNVDLDKALIEKFKQFSVKESGK